MMTGSDNYGVQIGGNANVQAGAIAGGPGARAWAESVDMTSTRSESVDALRSAIASLASQIQATQAQLADAEGMTQMIAVAEAEAAKERPSKGVLTGLLAALAAGAGGVTSIATAVTAVQHALSALF